MKKFVKLSLVAAVAVAGLTTANAKPLEEAIKGVDVTGAVAYRYQENDKKTGNEASYNKYKADIDLSIPAGDDLTMGLSFGANASSGITNTGTTTTGQIASGTTGVDVQLTGANFTYSGIANTTVTAGLQAIPTPWTVAADAMGTTHAGTGILAVSTISPVTLVGAYFNDTDIVAIGGSSDIAVVGAILNIAGVNAELMYADSADKLDSTTFALAYKLDIDGVKVGLSGRYTELMQDAAGSKKQKGTQGKITVAAGMFDAMVAYGENGKDGGLVSFDPTAKTSMEGWNTKLGDNADTEFLMTSIGAKVLPSVHVSLNYNDQDEKVNANDYEETYVQVKYQASKALSTYVRYGNIQKGTTTDGSAGRLHVQYSF